MHGGMYFILNNYVAILQSYVRASQQVDRFKNKKRIAIFFQIYWRRYSAIKKYRKIIFTIILIQYSFRIRCRKFLINSIEVIQKAYRNYQSRLCLKVKLGICVGSEYINKKIIKLLTSVINEVILLKNEQISTINLLFECPITRSIPNWDNIVYCQVDGRFYDYYSITKCIALQGISPVTREAITMNDIIRWCDLRSRLRFRCSPHPIVSNHRNSSNFIYNDEGGSIFCFTNKMALLSGEEQRFLIQFLHPNLPENHYCGYLTVSLVNSSLSVFWSNMFCHSSKFLKYPIRGLYVRIGNDVRKWKSIDLLNGLEAYIYNKITGMYYVIENCEIDLNQQFGSGILKTTYGKKFIIDTNCISLNPTYNIYYSHGKIGSNSSLSGWNEFIPLHNALNSDGSIKIELRLVD
tara:strand:+ start:26 stop:1246 length:1221 start_codon:yes stop_codon:yes gene_type:complete